MKSKLIFKSTPWDNGDYIISVRPDWEKKWKDVPIGMVVGKDEGQRIASWLNANYQELEKIYKNGYQRDEQ